MKRKILLCITLLGFVWFHDCSAQHHSTLTLPLLPGEQWWGGAVHYGHQMPFNQNSSFSFDLYGDPSNNQSSPLLVSNKGRWVWCDEPFRFSFLNDTLFLVSKNNRNLLTGTSGTTLASAYSYTSDHFFHTSGK